MPKKMYDLTTVIPVRDTKCGPDFDNQRAEISKRINSLDKDVGLTKGINVKPDAKQFERQYSPIVGPDATDEEVEEPISTLDKNIVPRLIQ